MSEPGLLRPTRHSKRLRVPVVTQTASNECGVACALAILAAHGRAENIADARDVMDVGRDGVSVRQISRFLESRNMTTHLLRVQSIDAFAGFRVPVIAHWYGSHFVVVEGVRGGWFQVMDPAIGRRRISPAQFAEGFSGVVVLAVPGEAFDRRRRPALQAWRSTRLLPSGSVPKLVLATLLAGGLYGATLGVPLATSWAINRPDVFGSTGVWVLALVAVAFAGLLQAVLYALRVWTIATLMTAVGHDLMAGVFRRLLRLPYKYFTSRQPGEIMYRLSTVGPVRDALVQNLSQTLLNLGTFVVVVALLSWLSPVLALVAAMLVAVSVGVVRLSQARVIEAVEDEMQHTTAATTMQLDAIVSLPTIRLGGYEQDFTRRWSEVYAKALRAMRTRMLLQDGRQGAVGAAVSAYGSLAILFVGLGLSARGALSVGDAVAAQMAAATLFGLGSSLLGEYNRLVTATRYLERLNEVREGAIEPTGGDRTEIAAFEIHGERVTFAYTSDARAVVDEATFDIPAGGKTAIVGVSGSGKSTLAKVIATLHPPTRGLLEIGGQPLEAYSLSELRRGIGYVPQEAHLHNRSLLENLTLGRDIDRDRVQEVLAGLRLEDLVRELPLGLQTQVTEMGANFSGGQRQRLAIARTLLQEPKLLILDEATASMDATNERLVYDFIGRQGLTQIVITHRLSTIVDSDQILVMDGGRITGRGTHGQLLVSSELYSSLHRAQAARGLDVGSLVRDSIVLRDVRSPVGVGVGGGQASA